MTTHSEHSNSKPTLETILNHRSIRKFTNQPIDAATFELLIEAGMAGSSSGFLQSASIIRVTDAKRRYDIRRICTDAQQAKDGEKIRSSLCGAVCRATNFLYGQPPPSNPCTQCAN